LVSQSKGHKIKSLVLEQYNQPVNTDFPDPQVGPNDVLIRVKSCGICGSDIHGMDGSSGRRIPPLLMGHEASGIIEAVGVSVTTWSAGDRVTFDSTVYCGECWFCRRGEINLYENRQVVGVSCGDYRRHGAFAEYVVVPSRVLYRLPDNLSFEQGAFVEPVSIAVHAVNRTRIRMGDTAAVIGSGMIGLLAVQMLCAAGCARVIAVDLVQDRLDQAMALGATVRLCSNKVNAADEIRARTQGRGADVTLEVVYMAKTNEVILSNDLTSRSYKYIYGTREMKR
jgi:L-iditol 2-dehydrogenase